MPLMMDVVFSPETTPSKLVVGAELMLISGLLV
jgi:hypothetical protein